MGPNQEYYDGGSLVISLVPGLMVVYALEYHGFINFHIRNLMLGPVFLALIVNVGSWPEWIFRKPAWIEKLGHASYPLYLLHGPFMISVGAFLLWTGMRIDFAVAFVTLVGTAFLLGHFVGIPLELLFLEKRRLYLRKIR